MIKTIILFGGKTMGHVIPGLATIKGLRKKNSFIRIIYITSDKQKDLKMLNLNEIDKIYFLNYKSSKNLKDIYHIYESIKNIYMLYHPNLVISYGSVIGTIGLFIAKRQNVKCILHEQNKAMGLGNKIGMHFTNNIFLNYKLKLNFRKKKNIKNVGLPTMLDFECINGLKNKNKIVFLSGSNGAFYINQLGIDFSKTEFSKNYEITIVSGEKYYQELESFPNNQKHLQIVPFVENLYLFLKDANFAITRGGATTLQELKKLGIKSIIIPSPNVSNNHQYLNALEHLDSSIIIEEKNCSIDELISGIKELEKKTIEQDLSNQTNNFIEALNEVYKIY